MGVSILCASRVEGEGNAKVRANVVLLAKDSDGDIDEGKWYQSKNCESVFQMRDSGHVDDGGEEGAATSDGKSLK